MYIKYDRFIIIQKNRNELLNNYVQCKLFDKYLMIEDDDELVQAAMLVIVGDD